MGAILRKYIIKVKDQINLELSDHNFNKLQEEIIEYTIKIYKIRAQNIETQLEAVKQISLYHVRESIQELSKLAITSKITYIIQNYSN